MRCAPKSEYVSWKSYPKLREEKSSYEGLCLWELHAQVVEAKKRQKKPGEPQERARKDHDRPREAIKYLDAITIDYWYPSRL